MGMRFRVSSHEEMNAWILALKNVRLKVIDQVTQSQIAKFDSDTRRSKESRDRVRRRSRALLLSDKQQDTLMATQKSSSGALSNEEPATGPPMDLHSGWVWKMGGSVRTWHRRFF